MENEDILTKTKPQIDRGVLWRLLSGCHRHELAFSIAPTSLEVPV